MKLAHPIADGIGRPAPSCSRAVQLKTVRLTAVVFLAAVALSVFRAHTAFAADPLVSLSLSSSSVPDGGSVTMTATVSVAVGVPTGTVVFLDATVAEPLGQASLSGTGSSATGSATVALPSRSYSVYALYTPDTLA